MAIEQVYIDVKSNLAEIEQKARRLDTQLNTLKKGTTLDVKTNLREVTKEIAQVHQSVLNLTRTKIDFQASQDSLRALKQEIEGIRASMRNTRAQMIEVRVKLRDEDITRDVRNSLNKEYRDLQNVYDKLSANLNRTTNQQAPLIEQTRQLKELSRTLENLEKKSVKLVADATGLGEATTEARILEKALQDVKEQMVDVSFGGGSTDGIASNLNGLYKQIEFIQESLQGFDSSFLNKTIDIKANTDSIQNELRLIEAELNRLTIQRRNIQLTIDNGEQARKQILQIDAELKRLDARRTEIKVELNSAGLRGSRRADLQTELQAINLAMDQLRNKRADLEVKVKDAKAASAELKSIDTEINRVNGKYVEIKAKADELTGATQDAARLDQELDKTDGRTIDINIGSTLKNIGGFADKLGNSIFRMLSPLSGQLRQWIGIGAAVRAVNSAVNVVTNSIDGAIDRYDAIERFPKALANFGIGADEADRAIKTLADGLDGLPTTLDTATSTVIRFAQRTMDMDISTDLFLSLNNALLGGAQSEQVRNAALEQFTQAYGRGYFDRIEIKSLMTAAPAQVEMIASTFEMTAEEMMEAITGGALSVDEFADAIIRLNKEGVNGFGSFEEQATAALGGIRVGMIRAQTAVQRGIADILKSFDGLFENTEYGNAATFVQSIGTTYEAGLKNIAGLVTENGDEILAVFDRIRNFDFAGVWSSFKETVRDAYETAKPFLDGISDIFVNLVTRLGDGDFATGLGRLPATLVKVGAGLKIFGGAMKFIGGVTNFLGKDGFSLGDVFSNMFGGKGQKGISASGGNGLTNALKVTGILVAGAGIIKILASAVKDINELPQFDERFSNKLGSLMVATISMGTLIGVMGALIQNGTNGEETAAKGVAFTAAITGTIIILAEALQQLNEKVPQIDMTFVGKISSIVATVMSIGGLIAIMGQLATNNTSATVAGLGSMLAVIFEIMLVAEAIKQVDEKVPEFGTGFENKIGSMILAIGAFAGLVGVIGGLIDRIPGGTFAAIAGLGTVAVIATEMLAFADVLKEVDDKVPEFGSGFENKIGSMSLAIGAFAGLVGVIGGLISGISGGAFAAIAGLGTIAIIGLEMVGIAEALKQVDDKVPEFGSGFENKIGSIVLAVGAMAGLVVVIGGLITGIPGGVFAAISGLATVGLIALEFVVMAEALKQVDEKVPEFGSGFEKKIGSIALAVGAMAGITGIIGAILVGTGGIGAVAALAGGLVVAEIAAELVIMAEAIKQVDDKVPSSFGDISKKLDNIKKAVEEVALVNSDLAGMTLTNVLGAANLALINLSIDNLIAIARRIGTLNDYTINEQTKEKFITTLESIEEIITALDGMEPGGEDSSGFLKNLQELSDLFSNEVIITTLKQLSDIADQIIGFSKVKLTPDSLTAVTENITSVSKVAKTLNDTTFETHKISTLITSSEAVKEGLQALNNIAEAIVTLNTHKLGDIDETITANIKTIRTVLDTIADEPFKITNLKALGNVAEEVKNGFTALNSIADGMIALSAKEIDGTSLTKVIDAIRKALDSIEEDPLPTMHLIALYNKREQIDGAITLLGTIIDKIMEIANGPNADALLSGDVTKRIQDIMTALNEILSAVTTEEFDKENLDNALDIVEYLEGILTDIENLGADFKIAGTNLATDLVDGFKGYGIPQKMKDEVDKAPAKLDELQNKFKTSGDNLGKKVVEGFKTGLDGMDTAINDMGRRLANQTSEFTNAGIALGTTLASGIQTALAGVTFSVNANVNEIRTPTATGNVRSDGRSIVGRRGYATGGIVAGPKTAAVDTIPAMLTAGEGVINKSAVGLFGTELINRMNNKDMPGVMRALGVGHTTDRYTTVPVSNTVYNVNNRDDHSSFNQVVHTSSPGIAMINAGRLRRGRG